MERDRQHGVNSRRKVSWKPVCFAELFAHPVGQMAAEPRFSLIFEQPDRLGQHSLVVARRAGGVERGRTLAACSAEMTGAVLKRYGRREGLTAAGTNGRRNRPDAGPAVIAKERLAVPDQAFPADPAGRRKNGM